MRPIRLEMEGFTSFRQTTAIDFSTLDLFAISGPTGAGKTSIIDAMIYALYGCTPRIGNKSIKELISQGSDRLKVMLEFTSGRSCYRIARETKWTGKNSITSIRLEEKDGESWMPLADKVGQADPIVESIVGLDFNGFTKSVVLPQGRFDEFLKGRIDERRKILLDLLQLDIYSRMMQRANEIAKENKNKSETLADLLARDYANSSPENLARAQRELERLKPSLKPLTLELKNVRESMPVAYQLRQAVSEITISETELKQLGPARTKAETNLVKARQEIQTRQGKIDVIDARIRANAFNSDARDELVAKTHKSEQLIAVEKRARELENIQKTKSRQSSDLESRHKKAEASLNGGSKQRDSFETQLRLYKKNQDEALRKHGSADAIKAVIDINKRRLSDERKKVRLEKDAARLKEDQASRAKKLERIDLDLAKAQNELRQFKADLEVLSQKHAAEGLKQLLEGGKPCPVCEQVVTRAPRMKTHPSIEHARNSVVKHERELHRLISTKSDLEGGLRQLTPQLESKRQEIEECDSSIREATAQVRSVLKKSPGPEADVELEQLRQHVIALQEEFDGISEKVKESREAESSAKEGVAKIKRDLVEIQSQISACLGELSRLQKESRVFKASLGKHADITVLKTELKEQDDAKRSLEADTLLKEAETKRQSEAKDAVAEASRILEGLKVKGEGLERIQAKLNDSSQRFRKALVSAFPDLKIDTTGPDRDAAAQLERSSLRLQTEREAIQKRISQHEEEIKTLKVIIKRAGEMRKEMEIHRTEGAVAHELAQALRGDQFIAFIQQEAYHRLALDGSKHLKTLSSDRYSFGFDKDEFVVLDHWNADEPRPVTTLSGGETFLASLALALALAEGLSGLSHGRGRFALESLFLDEGFGTLDAETLDVVLQGVENLSTTDRLVGIVSHIPELADRMPSRIYVRKAVGGSTVECS